MHYIVSSALNKHMPNINQIAMSNNLHIATLPEYIVNGGIIDVQVLSPFSSLDGMLVGLRQLGFTSTNWVYIGGDYYRIQITGYLGG